MSSEYEYVQRLVRLKRYEKPDDFFYEEFLEEYRRRRELGLDRKFIRPTVSDRLTEWFVRLGSRRWLYATGVAYAIVMIGMFFLSALRPNWQDGRLAEIDAAPEMIPVVKMSGDESGDSMLKTSRDEVETPSSSKTK